MTSRQVEKALVLGYGSRFHYRKMLVVPNVSWGLGIHECDLLAMTKAGVAHEIEIKVSRHDLLQDKKKRHGHHSQKIKYLWFAGPEELRDEFIAHCPGRAGIITVKGDRYGYLHITVIREAKANSQARALKDHERYQLARLGTMRFWTRYERDRDNEREILQIQDQDMPEAGSQVEVLPLSDDSPATL